MVIELLSNEEVDDAIELLDMSTGNVGEVIDSAFEEILFLGNAITTVDPRYMSAWVLSYSMCYRYYLLHENYTKLQQLVDVKSSIENSTKIELDTELIQNISLNIN